MQPVPSTGWRSLFKLEAYRLKLLKPPFSPKVLNILDEGIPRRQKRVLVTLLIAVVPSMSEEDIEVEILFSAKVARAGA